MTTNLVDAIIRILDTNQKPIGAGILVGENYILTCAHVVNSALGRKKNYPDRPDSEDIIAFDFPIVAAGKLMKAQVSHWWPDEDVSGLTLLSAIPADLSPVPLRPTEVEWGSTVKAFGLPLGYPDGQWVEGITTGKTGKGRLEIKPKNTALAFIRQGFSGGPVWTADQNEILGITVESDEEQTAYCIPTHILIALWPDLKQLSIPSCPYQGLFAFREKDAPFFFGRDNFVDRLVTAVQSQPLVAVLGPSGSGKSSVVFAGLLPRLREQEHCRIITFRPGNEPFKALATSLVTVCEPDLKMGERWAEINKMSNLLEQDKDVLRGIISDFFGQHPNTELLQSNSHPPRFLIIVDQFEELYTLSSDSKIHRFLDLILETLTLQIELSIPAMYPSPVTWLITLRADFLGEALSYRPFSDALQRPALIGPMNRIELAQSIEKPAQIQNVTFAEGLVERILNDIGYEPGNLPLLEFALTQLWARQTNNILTNTAYESIGRVKGALTYYADQVYARLEQSDQEQVRRIFVQLVEPNTGTRKVATRTELNVNWSIVKRLADARLVVTNRNLEGIETVELVHEVLIQGWNRLRGWMAADRNFRAWQEGLRVELERWKTSDRDYGTFLRGLPLAEAERWLAKRGDELRKDEREFINASIALQKQEEAKRQTQRRKIIGLISITVVLIIVALSIGIWSFQKDAKNQRRLTSISQSREFAALSLNELSIDPEKSLSLILEAVKVATDGGVSPDDQVQSALAQILNTSYRYTFRRENGVIDNKAVLSPNEDMLAIASQDGNAALWHLDGSLLTLLGDHGSSVTDITFDPSGQLVATASDDGKVRLWKIDGSQLWKRDSYGENTDINKRPVGVKVVRFNYNGSLIAAISSDGTIRIWDKFGDIIQTLFVEGTNDLEFSTDDTHLVIGGFNGMQIWNTESWDSIEVKGHSDQILDLAISPNDEWIATASRDNTARLWRLDGTPGPVLYNHNSWVEKVIFHPTGKWVLTGSQDGAARLWSIEGHLFSIMPVHKRGVDSLAISPDGRWFLSGDSQDGHINLWRLPDPKSMEQISSVNVVPFATLPHDSVLGSVFTADSASFVSYGKATKLWQIDGAIGSSTWCDYPSPNPESFGISDDGSTVIFGSDSRGTIWNTKTSEQYNLDGGGSPLAISPDGSVIAGIDNNGNTGLWDAKGSFQHNLSIFTQPPIDLTFDSSGQWIAGIDKDGYLTVQTLDQQEGLKLGVHKEASRIEFNTLSTSLISISTDRVIEWPLNGEEPKNLWSNDTNQDDNKQRVALGYHPLYQYVIVSSFKGTTELWDSQDRLITSLNFSGQLTDYSWNSSTLVLANSEILQVWDLEEQKLQFQIALQKPLKALSVNTPATQLAILSVNDCLIQLQPLQLKGLVEIALGRLHDSATTGDACIYLNECSE